MTSWRWLLPVYAPLAALAAASFWLSPGDEAAAPPAHSVALYDARYARAEAGGDLRIAAGRMEYDGGAAMLFALQLSRSTADGGRIILRGESGEARRGADGARRIAIRDVRGEIGGGGRRLTLRAESVFYDTADGGLSGVAPRISGGGGELRGDKFIWRADSGWKIEGDVESIYRR